MNFGNAICNECWKLVLGCENGKIFKIAAL